LRQVFIKISQKIKKSVLFGEKPAKKYRFSCNIAFFNEIWIVFCKIIPFLPAFLGVLYRFLRFY